MDEIRIVLTPTADGEVRCAEGRNDRRARRRSPPDRSRGGQKKSTVVTRGNNPHPEGAGSRVEDPAALKALIGQTARLEPKLVDRTANPAEEVAQGRAPAGSEVLPLVDGGGDRRPAPGDGVRASS
jgi:preprotein translocase subunit SecD